MVKEFIYADGDEGILYAGIDLDRCIDVKQYHDVVGGYQRLDGLQLQVHQSRKNLVTFTENTDIE